MTVAAHDRPIRIAVLSSLFPNAQQPRHGIFVEQRLRHLLASGEVEARVVAPVPWFWSTHPRYGRYGRLAAVEAVEYRDGLEILHPRYIVLPKVGMTITPATMAWAAGRALARLQQQGFDFDLIDAHYFYPDGVAAARLAKRFDKPLVVTARGADINTIAAMHGPARQIRAAVRTASALIGVSESLSKKMESLGVPENRITTLRNGVDLGVFAPMDRAAARARLGVSGPVWLCVGHMIERKGMHIVIEALAAAPDVTLVIAGDGPNESALRQQVKELGVEQRVRFMGSVNHDDLPRYYNAADALVLPTRSEGMPNVVLEALACGTAVVASAVDGIPEIMTGRPAGRLLRDRSAVAVIEAWQALRGEGLDASARAERRRYAEQFSWAATTAGQLEIFHRLAGTHGSRRGQVATRRAASERSG